MQCVSVFFSPTSTNNIRIEKEKESDEMNDEVLFTHKSQR